MGIEQTCERISLPAAVSLIDQAIPVVPTVSVSRLLLVFVDPQPKYFYCIDVAIMMRMTNRTSPFSNFE